MPGALMTQLFSLGYNGLASPLQYALGQNGIGFSPPPIFVPGAVAANFSALTGLLTAGVGLYPRHQKLAAVAQKEHAAKEAAARQRADELRAAQQKLAEEKEKHNQELSVALDQATKAEAQAKAADARAESERRTVLNAVDASTRMVVAENAQNDLDLMLQLDTEVKKDPAILDREKQARDAATKKNELRATAGLRRSFSTFKFYVKKGGQWQLVRDYSPRLRPALAYGGSCGSQPCLPAPAPVYADGNVLADCINLPPVTGQEFRASFVQWVSAAERFSGPRILQLDGYSHPDCKK
jgi:hypothetical protein